MSQARMRNAGISREIVLERSTEAPGLRMRPEHTIGACNGRDWGLAVVFMIVLLRPGVDDAYSSRHR